MSADTQPSHTKQPARKPVARALRWLARRPKLRTAFVLALPAALVLATDLSQRGSRLLSFPLKYVGSYAASVLEGGLFWALLLACASARRSKLSWPAGTLFVLLGTIALGTQLYFHKQYSTYFNLDTTLFGTSMANSVLGQLSADSGYFLATILPPMLMAVVLVWLGRTLVRTRRKTALWLSGLLAPALLAVLFIPCSYRAIQGSTPDVLYFHAMGGLLKNVTGIEKKPHVRPMRRHPPRLPKLSAKPPLARNVLFILTESIRADLGCPDHRDDCPVMPFSNRAAAERIGLHQMRANSSTTAIQLAVLWTGREPTAGREALHSAPVLFDYADAAGWQTAYWSSHHMMFANSRLFVQDLPTRFQCGATRLDPLADIDLGANDALLTARVKEEIVQLREPFFAMAHYGNTHLPYLVDPNHAPFRPYRASKDKADNEAYRNFYKNAVYLQDKTIAELIRFVRSQPFAERTVIVYTADHGEQFREHGQLGHTGSVFDVELLTPTWVDAPGPSLLAKERKALRSYAHEPTFHTDLTPTMLDLMGLWQISPLAELQRAMVGSSLLRPGKPTKTLALSNCSGVWGCAFENWGVMRGWRKLHAREWDQDWLCYDVRNDPLELEPLPSADCTPLRREAEERFGYLPGRGPSP